jgi:hypothetical protein
MNKYNDSLNNETEVQIISTYRRPISHKTKDIISDLGTLVGEKNNSNSNSNLNLNLNLNKNTFHPFERGENGCVPEARTCPKEELARAKPEENVLAFGSVMAAQHKPAKFGFRRLSHNDHYTEINIQVGNVREEGRTMRCRVYVSLKDQYDKKYSIFLSGAATNSKKELIRGAKQNQQVLDVIEIFKNMNPDCMIARLHYKAVNGYQTDFHKKNLKSAILSIYEDTGILNAKLYLLGEIIDIELNQKLTKKQQEYYVAAGIYRNDLEQFASDDEELE